MSTNLFRLVERELHLIVDLQLPYEKLNTKLEVIFKVKRTNLETMMQGHFLVVTKRGGQYHKLDFHIYQGMLCQERTYISTKFLLKTRIT